MKLTCTLRSLTRLGHGLWQDLSMYDHLYGRPIWTYHGLMIMIRFFQKPNSIHIRHRYLTRYCQCLGNVGNGIYNSKTDFEETYLSIGIFTVLK